VKELFFRALQQTIKQAAFTKGIYFGRSMDLFFATFGDDKRLMIDEESVPSYRCCCCSCMGASAKWLSVVNVAFSAVETLLLPSWAIAFCFCFDVDDGADGGDDKEMVTVCGLKMFCVFLTAHLYEYDLCTSG